MLSNLKKQLPIAQNKLSTRLDELTKNGKINNDNYSPIKNNLSKINDLLNISPNEYNADDGSGKED